MEIHATGHNADSMEPKIKADSSISEITRKVFRIIESSRLEKIFKTNKSNIWPNHTH